MDFHRDSIQHGFGIQTHSEFTNSAETKYRFEVMNQMPSDDDGIWKKINNTVPAVVLKFDHYQSLGIIRSLGKLGVPVYGIDSQKNSHSSFSRYCKYTFIHNLEEKENDKIINYLINISEKLKIQPVLIPTSDETALFLSRNSKTLSNYFLFPENSPELISSLCSKKSSYYLAAGCSIPAAKTFFPESLDDVNRFMRDFSFPVMLKGINGGKLEKKSGKKMAIIKSKQELISFYQSVEDKDDPNLMIQEFIPQSKNQMWIFNGYFNSSSDCVAAFTGIKLRQNPIYTGMTSLGICRWNETIVNLSIKFSKEIGYRGPVDIDFIYDPTDGQYKILDVNPRIGASFRMFVGRNGLDTVRALYLDLTNQYINFSKPIEGRKWVVEDKDLVSSVRYFKNNELKIGEWLSSFKGTKETGYFSISDPIPFLFLISNHLFRRISKLIKKLMDRFYYHRKNKNILKKSNPVLVSTNAANEQQLRVKNYYDNNKNWQGEVYTKSNDPHAKGIRRRKQLIFRKLDAKYNFENYKSLDIGCGPGIYINELNRRGSKTYGIDLSKEMLEICNKNVNGTNSKNFLVADCNTLPFNSGSFDLVMCVGVLQYVLSVEIALNELTRITASGGLVVICFENMLAFSNIGYSFLFWVKQRFKFSSSPKSNSQNNNNRIYSKWFLNLELFPHLYSLYNPWKFERMMKNLGFKKIEGLTYGFSFKSLRKIKIIPSALMDFMEKMLEMFIHNLKIPVLSYSGEYYIGFFQKEQQQIKSVE